MTINIDVQPIGSRSGRYMPGFQAFLGERLICESKTPFLSAARVLLREGVAPDTPLTMTHQGSSTVSLRSTVGVAAGLVVDETEKSAPRFKPYREFPTAMPLPVGRWSPRTAIVGSPDAIPSEHESPFSDDHCPTFA
jgi:hypothetical protein